LTFAAAAGQSRFTSTTLLAVQLPITSPFKFKPAACLYQSIITFPAFKSQQAKPCPQSAFTQTNPITNQSFTAQTCNQTHITTNQLPFPIPAVLPPLPCQQTAASLHHLTPCKFTFKPVQSIFINPPPYSIPEAQFIP
jgi:hypothetical protein